MAAPISNCANLVLRTDCSTSKGRGETFSCFCACPDMCCASTVHTRALVAQWQKSPALDGAFGRLNRPMHRGIIRMVRLVHSTPGDIHWEVMLRRSFTLPQASTSPLLTGSNSSSNASLTEEQITCPPPSEEHSDASVHSSEGGAFCDQPSLKGACTGIRNAMHIPWVMPSPPQWVTCTITSPLPLHHKYK